MSSEKDSPNLKPRGPEELDFGADICGTEGRWVEGVIFISFPSTYPTDGSDSPFHTPVRPSRPGSYLSTCSVDREGKGLTGTLLTPTVGYGECLYDTHTYSCRTLPKTVRIGPRLWKTLEGLDRNLVSCLVHWVQRAGKIGRAEYRV